MTEAEFGFARFMLNQYARLAVLFLTGGLASCLDGTTLVTPPPVPMGSVAFKFAPDSEDVATAVALGWQDAIPAFTFTIQPFESNATPIEYTTGADGSLTLQNVATGRYIVAGNVWLTEGQRSTLSPGDDALGFATRKLIAIEPGATAEIAVPASRRKSIVISEWAFHTHGYSYGGFLELYNNADTTVYLDGMLIAKGFDVAADYPNFPCSHNTVVTSDSTSIWARLIQKFPGGGRDYPLAPGATVVVATDAIDHRSLDFSGIDLRLANFEFKGQPDVDNPAVPNMVDVGISNIDHGLRWNPLASVAAIALPTDVASLPRGRTSPESVTDWIRLPRSIVLDVLWLRSNYAASEYAQCPRILHSTFDRAGGSMRGTDEIVETAYSVSRRVVGGIPGPRRILQHTRTSEADFIRTLRNPGQLP